MTTTIPNLEFINEPERWSRWPALPLKRSPSRFTDKRWKDEGILIAVEEHCWTVFLINMFMLPKSVKELVENSNVGRIVYPTPEAILADGWMVD